MEYNQIEKQFLDLVSRTDFKNLSRNDILTYASKLNELRPEVATQVLAQFPEFANVLKSTVVELKGIVDNVLQSDDESLRQFYEIGENELNADKESRAQYFQMAEKIREDCSKCLDKDGLTFEEIKEILEREKELLQMASEKDAEIRNHENQVLETADKKDTEKRHFDWSTLMTASMALCAIVGLGATLLSGGTINLKLPKK